MVSIIPSFLLLISLLSASGSGLRLGSGTKISGCSKDKKAARVVFACIDLDKTNADLCREIPPFEAIFKCSLDPISGRQTVKDVFELDSTFHLYGKTFTDERSINFGDAYLGRDLRNHCTPNCKSIIVVRPAEIFATTDAEYQALPTEAEAATIGETLSTDAIQFVLPLDVEASMVEGEPIEEMIDDNTIDKNPPSSDPLKVVPVISFWRPKDIAEPFSVAKMGMSIFGRAKIEEPAVTDSCKFFQRKTTQAFEELGMSMLAFFSPNGRFYAYSRLPSPKERHGYSSHVIQTLLSVVAKKKVPLAWPIPPKVPVAYEQKTRHRRRHDTNQEIVAATARQAAAARNEDRVTTEKSAVRFIWDSVLSHSAHEFDADLVDQAIAAVFDGLLETEQLADIQQFEAGRISRVNRKDMYNTIYLKWLVEIASWSGITIALVATGGVAAVAAGAVPAAGSAAAGVAAAGTAISIGLGGAEWAQEQEQGLWSADKEVSTREKLRWTGKMIRWAKYWLEPVYGPLMQDSVFPSMRVRHEIICAEPELKQFCKPDPGGSGMVVVDDKQPSVIKFKLRFLSTFVNFIVHDGGCDQGSMQEPQEMTYVDSPWEDDAGYDGVCSGVEGCAEHTAPDNCKMGSNCVWTKDTEGVCVGVNGCAEHTKALDCKEASKCEWFRGTWNVAKEFYSPSKGWKFDPGQQNFFSIGDDRDMTSKTKDTMHSAWTSYCDKKKKTEWASTKKIRYWAGMENPDDTRNTKNRCKFMAEKAKKKQWNSETFCEKLASKKHGDRSGNVGNNVVRISKKIAWTFTRSKNKCIKKIEEEILLIRNRVQEAVSLNKGDSIPSGIQEAKEENVAPEKEKRVMVSDGEGGWLKIPAKEDKWPEERCEACCTKEGKPSGKTWRATEIENYFRKNIKRFCWNGKTAQGKINRATTMHHQAKGDDCVKFCRFA